MSALFPPDHNELESPISPHSPPLSLSLNSSTPESRPIPQPSSNSDDLFSLAPKTKDIASDSINSDSEDLDYEPESNVMSLPDSPPSDSGYSSDRSAPVLTGDNVLALDSQQQQEDTVAAIAPETTQIDPDLKSNSGGGCCKHSGSTVNCLHHTCTCYSGKTGSGGFCTSCVQPCCRNGKLTQLKDSDINNLLAPIQNELNEIKNQNRIILQGRDDQSKINPSINDLITSAIQQAEKHWKSTFENQNSTTEQSFALLQQRETENAHERMKQDKIITEMKSVIESQSNKINTMESVMKQQQQVIEQLQQSMDMIQQTTTILTGPKQDERKQIEQKESERKQQPATVIPGTVAWNRPLVHPQRAQQVETGTQQPRAPRPQRSTRPDNGCSIIVRGVRSTRLDPTSSSANLKKVLVDDLQLISPDIFTTAETTYISFSGSSNHSSQSSVTKLTFRTADTARQILRKKRESDNLVLNKLRDLNVFVTECYTREELQKRKAQRAPNAQHHATTFPYPYPYPYPHMHSFAPYPMPPPPAPTAAAAPNDGYHQHAPRHPGQNRRANRVQ
jgi:hypothetical protein